MVHHKEAHKLVGWTFDMVEARLVEAMGFARQMEGGRWAFASDGPWHLIVKDWWDWAAHEERPAPRVRLSVEQIARMEEAQGWLRFAPERDRKLVLLAVTALAAGRSSIPWRALIKPMGLAEVARKASSEGRGLGSHGLRKRYGRAVTCICGALNGAEIRA